jgi:hypothetical protein
MVLDRHGRGEAWVTRDAGEVWQAKQVGDWLVAILRFAITLDESDWQIASNIAEAIDRLGRVDGPSFSFFRRTTGELCHAIADTHDPNRAAVLRRHLGRVDDPRYRRAFAAAVNLEHGIGATTAPSARTRIRADLWKGLSG